MIINNIANGLNIIKFFINEKVKIHMINNDNIYPLNFAAANGNYKIFKLLVGSFMVRSYIDNSCSFNFFVNNDSCSFSVSDSAFASKVSNSISADATAGAGAASIVC